MVINTRLRVDATANFWICGHQNPEISPENRRHVVGSSFFLRLQNIERKFRHQLQKLYHASLGFPKTVAVVPRACLRPSNEWPFSVKSRMPGPLRHTTPRSPNNFFHVV